jgi:hypothetical protein
LDTANIRNPAAGIAAAGQKCWSLILSVPAAGIAAEGQKCWSLILSVPKASMLLKMEQ